MLCTHEVWALRVHYHEIYAFREYFVNPWDEELGENYSIMQYSSEKAIAT